MRLTWRLGLSVTASEADDAALVLLASLSEGGCVCEDIASGAVLALPSSEAEELARLAAESVIRQD